MPGFRERLAELGFATYEDYLAAPHWQEFKETYRRSVSPICCAICGSPRIELHHNNYKRLGNEELLDVTPLCRAHHVEVHDWLKTNERNNIRATKHAVSFLRAKIGLPTTKRSRKPKPPKSAKAKANFKKQQALMHAKRLRKPLKQMCQKLGRWGERYLDDLEEIATNGDDRQIRRRMGAASMLLGFIYSAAGLPLPAKAETWSAVQVLIHDKFPELPPPPTEMP